MIDWSAQTTTAPSPATPPVTAPLPVKPAASGLLKGFLKSQGSRALAVLASLVFIVIAIASIRSFLRGGTPESAFVTTFICTETGKSFQHKIEMGETVPVLSPYSGKNTGVIAEPCYWTPDGKVKEDPSWVLLNEAIQKPGPTFCPDCGRLVVAHNPAP